jgi:hypothetical protein
MPRKVSRRSKLITEVVLRAVSLITTLQQIIRRHGYSRLYSGLSADTLSTVLSSFLYFLIYTSLEKSHHQWKKRKTTMASPAGIGGASTPHDEPSVLIGTIAGVLSKRLALPISAVCIRQQLGDGDKHESIAQTLSKMKDEVGLAGLFHIPLSSVLLALLPSLTLYFHERIARVYKGNTFIIAAISNALATIPLYPLILAKAQALSGHQRDRSFFGPFKKVIQQEGVLGLYKGLEAQLLKGVVQQGVMMVIKEK